MKEILQEYGGFVLSVILIGLLIASLKTGFINDINSSIKTQMETVDTLGS